VFLAVSGAKGYGVEGPHNGHINLTLSLVGTISRGLARSYMGTVTVRTV